MRRSLQRLKPNLMGSSSAGINACSTLWSASGWRTGMNASPVPEPKLPSQDKCVVRDSA